MALDLRFVTAPSLQEYFVDKDDGFPLSGGKVFFFSDVNRTQPKDVFELTGTPPNYQYSPLPNPVILSDVGTMQDNNGNDIIPYYFPFDEEGNEELYYIVVQNSLGAPQFTRQAWPNPTAGEQPGGDNELFNYIPNGQFLAHTDLPNDLLVAGSNVIAQGGWSFELPDPVNSTNFLRFVALPINNISSVPRFEVEIEANGNSLDDIKNLRIKFNDVNKFSGESFFTFGFFSDADITVPINIQIFKFFGTNGSPSETNTVATSTIVPGGTFQFFQFQFGANEGDIVDTVNNDDFVAIDIAFSNSISFTAQLTDFALVNGAVDLTGFPAQTNADMITRGVDGWTNVPAYNGYDLYLPKVLTRFGYQYDRSSIGTWGATFGEIISPLSTSPLPETNWMALDGASYIYADYSTIGIPFARLGDFLIANSPLDNTPMFGTGVDYATAGVLEGDDEIFKLTVNDSGTGVNPAADNDTTWTIMGIVDYNGSTTGSPQFAATATNTSIADTIIYKANTTVASLVMLDFTTGFTFDAVGVTDPFTGIYAQQDLVNQVNIPTAWTILTVPASSLVAGSGFTGTNFRFSFGAPVNTTYRVWFYFNGEIPPVAPGEELIQVTLQTSYTAQDVANIVRDVLNARQISTIEVTGQPPQSSYWTFQTNPSAVRSFYVWQNINGMGDDPEPINMIGIEVNILDTDDNATIALKNLIAINKYQYAVPDGPGMFMRNFDPNAMWDFDADYRWSLVPGLGGNVLGTFEYAQFRQHVHQWTTYTNAGTGGNIPTAVSENTNFPILSITSSTGGTETRPVNMTVNMFIRY